MVAGALEAGLVGRETLVDTKGPMRWGRFTIRDFHNYGPQLSVTDVIVKSSNIGTAHVAQMIGGTRQSVNKLLSGLVEDGLVMIERDTLVIRDVGALEARGAR